LGSSFIVTYFNYLGGTVNMEVRKDRAEWSFRLTKGSIFYAEEGDSHRTVRKV
jgi:hypothetical protein